MAENIGIQVTVQSKDTNAVAEAVTKSITSVAKAAQAQLDAASINAVEQALTRGERKAGRPLRANIKLPVEYGKPDSEGVRPTAMANIALKGARAAAPDDVRISTIVDDAVRLKRTLSQAERRAKQLGIDTKSVELGTATGVSAVKNLLRQVERSPDDEAAAPRLTRARKMVSDFSRVVSTAGHEADALEAQARKERAKAEKDLEREAREAEKQEKRRARQEKAKAEQDLEREAREAEKQEKRRARQEKAKAEKDLEREAREAEKQEKRSARDAHLITTVGRVAAFRSVSTGLQKLAGDVMSGNMTHIPGDLLHTLGSAMQNRGLALAAARGRVGVAGSLQAIVGDVGTHGGGMGGGGETASKLVKAISSIIASASGDANSIASAQRRVIDEQALLGQRAQQSGQHSGTFPLVPGQMYGPELPPGFTRAKSTAAETKRAVARGAASFYDDLFKARHAPASAGAPQHPDDGTTTPAGMVAKHSSLVPPGVASAISGMASSALSGAAGIARGAAGLAGRIGGALGFGGGMGMALGGMGLMVAGKLMTAGLERGYKNSEDADQFMSVAEPFFARRQMEYTRAHGGRYGASSLADMSFISGAKPLSVVAREYAADEYKNSIIGKMSQTALRTDGALPPKPAPVVRERTRLLDSADGEYTYRGGAPKPVDTSTNSSTVANAAMLELMRLSRHGMGRREAFQAYASFTNTSGVSGRSLRKDAELIDYAIANGISPDLAASMVRLANQTGEGSGSLVGISNALTNAGVSGAPRAEVTSALIQQMMGEEASGFMPSTYAAGNFTSGMLGGGMRYSSVPRIRGTFSGMRDAIVAPFQQMGQQVIQMNMLANAFRGRSFFEGLDYLSNTSSETQGVGAVAGLTGSVRDLSMFALSPSQRKQLDPVMRAMAETDMSQVPKDNESGLFQFSGMFARAKAMTIKDWGLIGHERNVDTIEASQTFAASLDNAADMLREVADKAVDLTKLINPFGIMGE